MILEYLKKRKDALTPWLKKDKISAYRVYSAQLEEFPYVVDVYGGHAVVYEFSGKKGKHKDAFLSSFAEVFHVSNANIVQKVRKVRERYSQYEKISGEGVKTKITEYGNQFIVNLTDYIDTGLFLHHRKSRCLIRDLCKNCKRMLNLFSYTGAFSVYAAAGGAEFTTSVDLSSTYTQWSKENFQLNGMNPLKHISIKEEAFRFLETARNKGWRYDIIVLDPPSFSNSKKMSKYFDIQADHASLIRSAFDVLNEDGKILFASNLNDFVMNSSVLREFKVTNVTSQTIPEDFMGERAPHIAFLLEYR